MTKEEKQKAIDALKISTPIMAMTQEEFNDYIQTLNKVMDWLEQEPTIKNDLEVDCISRADAIKAMQNKAKKLKNEDTINGLCGAVAILYDIPPVTPLNEVLNKIKSEIYFLPRELPTDARNMVRRTRVLDIIDKYLAESEG